MQRYYQASASPPGGRTSAHCPPWGAVCTPTPPRRYTVAEVPTAGRRENPGVGRTGPALPGATPNLFCPGPGAVGERTYAFLLPPARASRESDASDTGLGITVPLRRTAAGK